MNVEQINLHLRAYKDHGQILDAANYLMRSVGLEHDNFAGFDFREEFSPTSVLLTTEGILGEPQHIKIPRNLFDFDLMLVLNLLAHEMLHVVQKAPGQVVEDKNEREWQAYYEMLFHEEFPQIPDAPDFNRKQFAEKALEYYRRMGEGSPMQLKYAEQKQKVESLLKDLLINRGERAPR